MRLMRAFNKIMTWELTSPRDILADVKRMRDRELLELVDRCPLKRVTNGSAQDFQRRAAHRELRRRHCVYTKRVDKNTE